MEVGEALRRGGWSGAILVLGRHDGRTSRLAAHLDGHAAPLARLRENVPALGGLVTATSAPRAIVGDGDLAGARRGLVVVDLGMPPNVDPGAPAGGVIRYVGLDDLAPGRAPAREIVEEAEAVVRRMLAGWARERAHDRGNRAERRRAVEALS